MGLFTNGTCTSSKRLDGKIVIITGSNTGIGRCTALDLARRGAEVVMACRNVEKAEEAANGIRSKVPEANLKIMHLDLSSLTSVRRFSEDFKSCHSSLHYLINNAGVMMCPWGLTEDGFEIHFGTNHLGHFLLTLLLLPTIIESAPSRIINVSSIAHKMCSSLNFDDINYEKGYSPVAAYCRSKLANILFTQELSKRLNADTEVKVVSLHPGVVDTELPRHFSELIFPGATWIYRKIGGWFMKSPEQGAQTTLFCALEDSVEPGLYYDDCDIGVMSEMAQDPDLAKELWDKSIELVKLEMYNPFPKVQ